MSTKLNEWEEWKKIIYPGMVERARARRKKEEETVCTLHRECSADCKLRVPKPQR